MAKLTDDQLRFIIDIEANGAQGQINSLSAEIGKLEKQNASLSSSISKVNNELDKQEKKLAKMEAAGITCSVSGKGSFVAEGNSARALMLAKCQQAVRTAVQQARLAGADLPTILAWVQEECNEEGLQP